MGKNILSGVAIIAVLAVSIFILASPTARGALMFALWDPDDGPLQCTSGDQVVLKDKTLTHPLHPLIVAGKDCRLTLRNCTLKAKRPLAIEGEVELLIEGGTIEADEIALTAAGKAVVELRNVELSGTQNALLVSQGARVTMKKGRVDGLVAVVASDNAKVTLDGVMVNGTELSLKATGHAEIAAVKGEVHGRTEMTGEATVAVNQTIAQARAAVAAAARKAAAEDNLHDKYSHGACDGVVVCLQKADIAGLVDIEIKMTVDGKGKVKTVRHTGVPPEARRCVDKNAKQKRIAKYKGAGGLLSCTVTGTIMPDSDSADKRTGFVPREGNR